MARLAYLHGLGSLDLICLIWQGAADEGGGLACFKLLGNEALQAEDSRRRHETPGSISWSRPGREATVLVGSYLHDLAGGGGGASDKGKGSCLFRVAQGDLRGSLGEFHSTASARPPGAKVHVPETLKPFCGQ